MGIALDKRRNTMFGCPGPNGELIGGEPFLLLILLIVVTAVIFSVSAWGACRMNQSARMQQQLDLERDLQRIRLELLLEDDETAISPLYPDPRFRL
jgi:hypothetical protein